LNEIESGTPDAVPKPKSGRPCRTCLHPEKPEIERLLLTAEITTKAIAARYGISEQALARHRAHHLPIAARQEAAGAIATAEANRGASLLDQSASLREKALAILATAERSGKLVVALQAIREVARLIELDGKLMGQIDQSTTINVTMMPIVVNLQSAVLRGLRNHPTARADVLRELAMVTDGPPLIEHQA
jgi:hypothetical protein